MSDNVGTDDGLIAPAGDQDSNYITVKQIKHRSDVLLGHEFTGIKSRLDETDHDENTLMGLALSGGGIRSATFSLGVLQALAAECPYEDGLRLHRLRRWLYRIIFELVVEQRPQCRTHTRRFPFRQ